MFHGGHSAPGKRAELGSVWWCVGRLLWQGLLSPRKKNEEVMQQLVCIPLHRSEWLAGCSSPAPDAGSRGSLPADDREVSGSAVRWCVVGVFRSCRGCQFKLDLCSVFCG